MLHLLSNIFRKNELRATSSKMDSAINHALTADTVADAVSKPYISEEGALNLSAVWACVRILSETVGTLPVHLYRRTAQGRERQYSHPCRRLLQLPNSYSNRFDLMHHLMVSTTLWGNGYVRIHRDRFCRPWRLELLHPMNVEPVLTTNQELFYYIATSGKLLSNDQIIHIRSLRPSPRRAQSRVAETAKQT